MKQFEDNSKKIFIFLCGLCGFVYFQYCQKQQQIKSLTRELERANIKNITQNQQLHAQEKIVLVQNEKISKYEIDMQKQSGDLQKTQNELKLTQNELKLTQNELKQSKQDLDLQKSQNQQLTQEKEKQETKIRKLEDSQTYQNLSAQDLKQDVIKIKSHLDQVNVVVKEIDKHISQLEQKN